MESNNAVTAPQINNVEYFYEMWKRNHTGTLQSFYEFMTTPSPDRDEFINLWNPSTTFNGAVVSVTLTNS